MTKRIALAVVLLAVFCSLVTPAVAQTTRPIAAIKDYGLKDYVRLSKALPHSETVPWKLVCELPYNCQFQPSITVDAPAGQTIKLDSTDPLVLFLQPTQSFTTTGGEQTYEAPGWVSGEGASYTIPANVTVKSVQYRETGVDTNMVGSFHCNDDDYNILWQKGARTVYLCMRDHFYDCPDRERHSFWGDGTPEMDQCFYLFDKGFEPPCRDLVRGSIQPRFYPGQHLEFAGDYGLWFYYLQTGDLDSLRVAYEPTRHFLFQDYQFGKANTWFDWGKDVRDIAVTELCFYYMDLKVLKKIALATGHDADVPAIEEKLRAVEADFDNKYWTGDYYKSEKAKTADDRANAMAVNAGLADQSKWEAIYNNVLTKREYSSCFFDRWVFEALCKMEKEDYAMLRMYRRYRTMIPCTFTTLWEHYDRWWASWVDAFDPGSTLNHGWNPPVLLLSQTIAGLSPDSPGWADYHLLPREAFLTSIQCTVPTIRGKIRMELNKTASDYQLELASPAATKATIGIPRKAFSSLQTISANGTIVWDGKFLNSIPGLAWAGEDAGYIKFAVDPGQWKFDGHGTLHLESPKPAPVAQPAETALDKRDWTASASVSDGVFHIKSLKEPIDASAGNAIDGDHWTGWRDMTKPQYPGQWFQLDLKQAQTFDRIVLDNTWALWDSPVGYTVTVSDDAEHWSTPVATGAGELGITTIGLPAQTARYVRITQTGTSKKYNWSIFEIDLYRSPDVKK